MDSNNTPTAQPMSINALYRSTGKSLQVQRGPEDAQAVLVDLDTLQTSRYQKRVITPERVRQLAETIRQNGLLQPVTARHVGDQLELIAGHRRRDAFKLLREQATTDADRTKWSRVPCIIRLGLTELQAAALSAVENLERDDGDPLEQGLSLLEVKKAGGFTSNAQVAEATGMNLPRVNRLVRLAEAPAVIQTSVAPGILVEVVDSQGNAKRERRRLDLTLALAVLPYFKHHERTADVDTATDRTEKLLARAARFDWARARLEAELKRLLSDRSGSGATAEDGVQAHEGDVDAEAQSEPAASPARRILFRDRGDQWVLYPKNISRADRSELARLAGRLRRFLSETENHLEATSEADVTGGNSSEPSLRSD